MNRNYKALLLSLLIHVAVLSALALLRPVAEPGTGISQRYVEVAFIDGPTAASPADDGSAVTEGLAADNDGVAEDAPQNDPEEPPPDADSTAADAVPSASAALRPETPPEEPTASDARTPDTPADEPAEGPAATLSASAAAAGTTESPPDGEAADEPAATPDEADEVLAAENDGASTDPATAEPETSTAAVRAVASDQRRPTVPEPATEPPVPAEQTPVADVEAELLEARIADLAERFTAFDDWDSEASWEDAQGSYTARLDHRPSTDGSGYDEATVTIQTHRDGRTMSTRMRLRRLGFAHFAQFVDRWDPRVQIHDDTIEGRFHSNSDILIQRSRGVQPTFLGKVTTARNVDTSQSDRRVNRGDVFLGGLETRVGRIPLPVGGDLLDGKLEDPAAVLTIERDTRLIFDAAGGLSWSPVLSKREKRAASDVGAVEAAGSGNRRLPIDAPFYVLGSGDAEIRLSGTLNGRVLVYSPEDIVIEGDLVYAAHPLRDEASDDYLGLVSDRSIAIAEPADTGPGDLRVHAAIYARQRFVVRSFRSRPSGELRVVGSITAGSISATEPRFSTRLIFDQRLAEARPPNFPVTDQYEIAGWDEHWTIEP